MSGVTRDMRGFDEFQDIVHYIEKSTYQIWDQKNLGLIYRYYTPATVVHTSDGDTYGYEEVVRNSTIKMAAFPDIRDLIEDVVWTGNDRDGYRTSMRWTWTARNTGHSVYGPPTGRRVVVSGMANCVIRGENVVEEWVVYNELSLLRQLGLDVRDVLRGSSAAGGGPPPAAGSIDRLSGLAPPPVLPPPEPGGFDVEDFVRRSTHDIWNRRMFGKIADYYAPGYRCHAASNRELYGRGDFTRDVLARVAAFPDATMHIDDLYWNDDGDGRYRTAVLWTMLGTNDGPSAYGPPTGRRVRITGITQHRIKDGKFVEEWTEYGEYDLLKQLRPPPEDREPAARNARPSDERSVDQ